MLFLYKYFKINLKKQIFTVAQDRHILNMLLANLYKISFFFSEKVKIFGR